MQERLQKVIAGAGIASRRKAEQLIAAGRVQVNGETVTTLGTKVDVNSDEVTVDGRTIGQETFHYYMFYKPTGVITSVEDQFARKVVTDYFKRVPARMYPVGRLDYDTEGLLLMTNDGELTHRLTHPSYEIEKSYLARVKGVPNDAALMQLRRGVALDDGLTAPARASLVRVEGENAWLRLVIHEGRNRQVRRMCAAVGFPVLTLKRDGLGCLTLGKLTAGQYRPLQKRELDKLRQLVGLNS
ncbi:pseudouridine synthase [Numidum massiliense]|uniref:pseudouridine synthase n=1 Tax=Numidum massiliense TaxID=1522315 RepID=UPI0006D55F15|nr:pseudouridine synthase [Numidum massiliense]